MKLETNTNYIISGLERSGTSMLMQMVNSCGIPTCFDESRPADENNPKGYYELEGGKIINKLIADSLPIEKYKGKFIKITAYGIKYLPPGKYKIIYSERNIEEILDSMEKMIGEKDKNRDETRSTFVKLNNTIKKYIRNREDIEFILVDYNKILKNPKNNIRKIIKFLDLPVDFLSKMMNAVDNKLYRQKRTK
ncbi:MAG: sulfotransferase domain-containing protein [Thermoplasmatales archaeon]|nr:MAG: sulfotransferase domain-containing protein [Thermoplasmatales archaeon]